MNENPCLINFNVLKGLNILINYILIVVSIRNCKISTRARIEVQCFWVFLMGKNCFVLFLVKDFSQ